MLVLSCVYTGGFLLCALYWLVLKYVSQVASGSQVAIFSLAQENLNFGGMRTH